jgi:hypothetical protein
MLGFTSCGTLTCGTLVPLTPFPMTNARLNWLEQTLLDNCPWIKRLKVTGYPQMTPEEWLKLWISWGYPKEFFWVLGYPEPFGLLVLRPISADMIKRIKDDYFGTITEYDPAGEITMVDYAYGPGHYDALFAVARATRRPWLAWEHRFGVHIERMDRMPKSRLLLGRQARQSTEPARCTTTGVEALAG